MKQKLLLLSIQVLVLFSGTFAQEKNFYPPPMSVDVGAFVMPFDKASGEGGLQSQFSWTYETVGNTGDISFNWPRDVWKSNMLYQIFNPVCLDNNGIIDKNGKKQLLGADGNNKTVNMGQNDWAREFRRYRPPHIVVDGTPIDAPYRWYLDPTLKSDVKIEFEDISAQFGMRSHVEVYAFSQPGQDNYIIWKATHKFTGEIRPPKALTADRDTLPDQSITFWWPISFSLGPTKGGTKMLTGGYGYEPEDDLDSWFKKKSVLVPNRQRDSLYVAYYWDSDNPEGPVFSNGSKDDTGDPDRANGSLYSTTIPGFTLLYADKSVAEKIDNPGQPYSMPHANIDPDIWGRTGPDTKLTYRGDDSRGRFPLDPITANLQTAPGKGPMRFITCGPYTMTKNSASSNIDSITFVYALGAGSIGRHLSDSVGREWFAGKITDEGKREWILKGRDSLFTALDRANWAYDRIRRGLTVPSAPPPPDINVVSGPNIITVSWSYPEESYFRDFNTGVDDWDAWKVYRKKGALLVNDPLDEKSNEVWELVAEIKDRKQTTFVDSSVIRGVDYYYAVTAVDNGSQGSDDIVPFQRLESSRYVNRSMLPAVPFRPGLAVANQVRVVPNPATVAAGGGLNQGNPDKISFFNLPYKCVLKIFTETGDLVKVIPHEGTADEEWNQRTDENQYVSSGIYILAVTEAGAQDGKSLDNQFVKFVLVR
ncbi:MAG: hypothetical protein ACM3SM_07035 [Bacteroidota bacterium]